jgi:hypothetical protein
MKRLSIILILIFLLLSSIGLFAEDQEDLLVRSGTITFQGYIQAGLYFDVSSLTEESFDLLATEALLPSGEGVDIGQWTLRIDNPPVEAVSFTIQYEYGDIENLNEVIADTIDFVVLERTEEEGERVVRESLDTVTVTISAGSGLNVDSRIFSVRLTDAGLEAAMRAAASPDYRAYVTVSLISE